MLISADMGKDGIARGRAQQDQANFMRTCQEPDYPARLDEVYTAARDQAGDQLSRLQGNGRLPDPRGRDHINTCQVSALYCRYRQ
jgi:hypothetical protein